MKRMMAVVLLVVASLGLPGGSPRAARADNTAFGDLLTTINNSVAEVTALQALAASCSPTDPCVPAGGITPVDVHTLAGFNQRSFDNIVLHQASGILALRGALGALNVEALLGCQVSDQPVTCGVPLADYLRMQQVDLTTVVAAVGIPPNPIRLYVAPVDPCVPQLTVAACKGGAPGPERPSGTE